MKTVKSILSLSAIVSLCLAAAPARAQWNQSTGVGPYIYTDPANWVGGIINNVITNPGPVSGVTLVFTNNFILTNGLLMNFSGNSNVTFQSDSATPRVLTISLGHFLRTNQSGGIITVGTTNNPLTLNINNSTRTIGGVGSGNQSIADATMNIYAKVTDLSGNTNGVNLGLGRIFTYLLCDSNDFVGPVSFAGLRGGGFSSIKNIGAGPSAMGAPTDTTNGTVTVVDNTSFGHVDYLGSGDNTDRPFVWNLTAVTYSFQNLGSGKITFTGPWLMPFNVTRSNTLTINAATAPIQFDGWLHQTNATLTNIIFRANGNTNRITLTCATNNYMGIDVTNAVVAYNNIADAGLPCALGTNGIVVHHGNIVATGSGNPSGHGADLQYFGPTANFTRTISLSGTGYNWGIENAGTNTTLTFTADLLAASTGSGATARNIWLNVNAIGSVTNYATIEMQGAIPDVASGIATTVQIANPTGYGGTSLNNGGIVRLLNPTNSFSGGIQIRYARTLQVTTLADTGQPSSIGTGVTPQTGLTSLVLGSTDSQRGAILSYVGTTAASCNRPITVLGSAGGVASATIQNNSPNNSSLHFSDPGAWALGSTMSNCTVNLGGSAIATNVLDTSIGNPSLGTGHLTVNGSTWELNGAYTYAGFTVVSNGTLLLQGSVGNNPSSGVFVGKGGALGGNGIINDNVTVLTNGTLSPGTSIGLLTVNGNLTNNGAIYMELNKAAGTNDQIVSINTLVYGGTLVVTNLSGSLTSTDSFKLFTASSYQGAFAAIQPTTPGTGLAWDLTYLTNGILKIVPGASNPPVIGGIQASGSNVILSGSGGPAGNPYYVVTATNLTIPFNNWTPVSTNVFDGSGNFRVTNTMNGPQEFFRVKLP